MAEGPLPLWVDTDMGHGTPGSDVDDAFALALLLAAQRAGKVQVGWISATFGNVPLEEAVSNTASLLEVCGAGEVSFLAGAPGPLLQDISPWRARQAASLVGSPTPYRAPASPTLQPGGGLWDLIRALDQISTPIQVLTLGPLTDLALVLRYAPNARNQIQQIIMMGGSAFAGGNVTASAELNIWLDPEAAAIVFESGIPIVMVGLDVTRQRPVRRQDLDGWNLEKVGTVTPAPLAYLRDGLLRWIACRERMWGESWMYLHDAVAAAYLLRPDLFRTVEASVAVELRGSLTRGMTVVDTRLKGDSPRNARVCVDLDAEAVFQLIVSELDRGFGNPSAD